MSLERRQHIGGGSLRVARLGPNGQPVGEPIPVEAIDLTLRVPEIAQAVDTAMQSWAAGCREFTLVLEQTVAQNRALCAALGIRWPAQPCSTWIRPHKPPRRRRRR